MCAKGQIGCHAGSTTTEHGVVPGRVTRIVLMDADPMAVGANYRYEAAMVGDARLCLSALLQEVTERLDGKARQSAAAQRLAMDKQRKREAFNALAASNDLPIRPERVGAALQRHLPANGIIVAAAGRNGGAGQPVDGLTERVTAISPMNRLRRQTVHRR